MELEFITQYVNYITTSSLMRNTICGHIVTLEILLLILVRILINAINLSRHVLMS